MKCPLQIIRRVLLYYLVFLALLLNLSQSQNIPQIIQADIPGGKILKIEHYNGNSLWGYIDGGADVYLEYGFTKLQVQEIESQNHHFKIEIYMMKDARAAFGIYSVSHRRCTSSDSLPQFNCITPHLLQISHGKLFIKIINDEGSDEEQSISMLLAKIIIGRTKELIFELPALFKIKIYLPYLQDLKFFKGPLGIQNGFATWDNLFEGIKYNLLFLLPLDIDSSTVYIAQIRFSSKADKNLFYKKHNITPSAKIFWHTKTGDTFKGVKELSSTEIYYVESDLKSDLLESYLKPIQAK